jgi:hypothetical protein
MVPWIWYVPYLLDRISDFISGRGQNRRYVRILFCICLIDFRSMVVNFLTETVIQEDVGVAYLYCDFGDRQRQTSANLLSSVLQQLAQQRSKTSDEILHLYRHHAKLRTRPSLAEFSKLLQSEVRYFSKVFVVIDALDECSDRQSLLCELRSIVHLLITSRSSLANEFHDADQLEIGAHLGDIARYIESRIEGELLVKSDSSLRAAIIDNVIERSQGMSVSTNLAFFFEVALLIL